MGSIQAGMRPTKRSQTCMMSVMHRYGYSFVQRNLTQPTACRSHHFTLRYCRNLNSISSYTRPNARNTHLGVPLQLATRPKLLRTAGKANLLLLTVFYCCCSPLFTVSSSATAAVATASAPAMSVAAVVVGWLVIGGSVFRSIPQIARILRRKRYETIIYRCPVDIKRTCLILSAK